MIINEKIAKRIDSKKGLKRHARTEKEKNMKCLKIHKNRTTDQEVWSSNLFGVTKKVKACHASVRLFHFSRTQACLAARIEMKKVRSL